MTSTLVIALDLSKLFTKFHLDLSLGMALVCPLASSKQPARNQKTFPKPRLGKLLLVHFLGFILCTLSACRRQTSIPPRKIVVQQSWELTSGDYVAGHLVTGGLGDISIKLNNTKLRAPFPGDVEWAADGASCIYYSTPEIPAYLFRYCGVTQPRFGSISTGQVMGKGNQIHFATLRLQPDGTWALVEPSSQVLEKTLRPPSRFSFF
jgi:hypothetical protein